MMKTQRPSHEESSDNNNSNNDSRWNDDNRIESETSSYSSYSDISVTEESASSTITDDCSSSDHSPYRYHRSTSLDIKKTLSPTTSKNSFPKLIDNSGAILKMAQMSSKRRKPGKTHRRSQICFIG
mmetsp:Transcript_33345/g.37924  ORF Transcript_33345/g.37924 Transcript_33345/m.37924 type:complete len:126 (+) Transcript_33345:64-441(+)